MKKTDIIIFSKNRTLQLKSLLLSLHEYSDFEESRAKILYVADNDNAYEPLEARFECTFLKESDFLKDVGTLVKASDAEYISFMVDDSIFCSDFSWDYVEQLLDRRSDIDAFTFRLGENIECGLKPEFRPEGDDVLIWNTREGLGRYWNYFWELCSSVYRKEDVLEYLKKCRPRRECFPNPFEAHYYTCMPNTRNTGIVKAVNSLRFAFRRKSRALACFRKSKSFTQGVNLVASTGSERTEYFSTNDLHDKMLEGYIADYKSIKDIHPEVPQPGPEYFKLVKESGLSDA